MNSYNFLNDIIKKYPFLLGVTIFLLTFAGFIEVLAIFSLVPVADFLIKTNIDNAGFITRKAVELVNYVGLPASLSTFIAIFLIFNIFVGILQLLIRYLLLKIKYHLTRDLIIGAFEDFFSAKWYFFSSNAQGTFINTFIKEVGQIVTVFWSMSLLFASGVQLILCVIVPICISWQVTVVSLTAAILFVIPFFLLGRLGYRIGQVNTRTANSVAAVMQESFGSAKLIIGFGNQAESIKMLVKRFDIYYRSTIKSDLLALVTPVMYNPIGLCAVFIPLFIAYKFAVPLSEMGALLYSLMKIVPAIGQIGTQKNMINSCLPSYEQFLNLRNSAKQMKQETGTVLFVGIKNSIVVENLSFSYPNHKPVLTDISLVIPRGKMIAIVGKSGSGKTTLVDMIIGLHKPSSGKILIDGITIQDLNMWSYRQRIGYVPQDSILFNATIRENLLWSKNDATDEEIKDACIMANAHEFIKNFPDGYETAVGDCGVRLSGGQRQRIALARAMLRKPDLLVLDEATSSLDTYSEQLIQKAIENIAKKTTVIIIAHRLSTVANADYIYVLKAGHLIEDGIYSKLVAGETEFHNMVKHQILK